jgi:signal transduction histidine kinase
MKMQTLEDRIFETNIKAEGEYDSSKKISFRYVQIKIKTIKDQDGQQVLIQIIDISHQILYDEIKAEKVFLVLINAAISHELRNPLNSLIGQIF